MMLELDHDLLKLLPPIYREVEDYQQICSAESALFGRLADSIEGIQENFFIQSMDVDSVKQWEQALRILADPSTESLEFRRQRILTRLRIRPPYTMTFLYQQLDGLLGEGNWTCEMDYPAYTLTIHSDLEQQEYYQEMLRLLNTIKPAHIVLCNAAILRSCLLVTEEISACRRTLNYKLGHWLLGRLPFGTNGETTVQKAKDVPSFLPAGLRAIASGLSDAITAAQFNGHTPGTLTKGQTETQALPGQLLTLDVDIPDSIGEANLFELLDPQGKALAHKALHFPVSGPTGLTLRLAVLEGAETDQYFYRYILGDWELGEYPFADENTAFTQYLGRTAILRKAMFCTAAQAFAACIAAVRLNGSRTVTKFKTQVSGSTITVEYSVAERSDFTLLNSIELLDAGGTPLTKSSVFILLQDCTILTHTFDFREEVLHA